MSDDELTPMVPSASASGARRGWRCPDDGQLAAYLEGGLAAELRESLENHLADCDFCLGQVGFLSRAGQLGPPPPVPSHLLALARGERSSPFGRLRPATLLAAGAGLVLALLVATPWGRPGSFPADPQEVRIVRNGLSSAGTPWIVQPVEGAVVPRAALELRWEAAPGALFYTVQIVDSNGDVSWEGRAEGARLAIPTDAALVPGQPYFAWILAHLRSGTTVRSPAVGFRLAPG